MNPVAQAINDELDHWRGKRTDAESSIATIDRQIEHLENTLAVYQDHPSVLEAEVAPDGDSNRTVLRYKIHLAGAELAESVRAKGSETSEDESIASQGRIAVDGDIVEIGELVHHKEHMLIARLLLAIQTRQPTPERSLPSLVGAEDDLDRLTVATNELIEAGKISLRDGYWFEVGGALDPDHTGATSEPSEVADTAEPPVNDTAADSAEEPDEPPTVKPELSKRDTVIAYLAELEGDREFTLQDIVDETRVNYGIVRDASKVAVSRKLIRDKGGRPKVFASLATPEEVEEPEAPKPSTERDNAKLAAMASRPEPSAPSPAKPLEPEPPSEDFLDQIFEAIESEGPILEHELPAITGVMDGSTLKRALSALVDANRVHDSNAGWVAGPSSDKAEPTEAPDEDATEMTEEERGIRDGVLSALHLKPRTGSQLSERVCRPIKEIQPVLEALEAEGEIEKERSFGAFKRWRIAE